MICYLTQSDSKKPSKPLSLVFCFEAHWVNGNNIKDNRTNRAFTLLSAQTIPSLQIQAQKQTKIIISHGDPSKTGVRPILGSVRNTDPLYL